MKGAWRAIREARLLTNDTREKKKTKKQEARSLAQLIINAKMMFLIMNSGPKRWCFLIPSGRGEKKGKWAFLLFFSNWEHWGSIIIGYQGDQIFIIRIFEDTQKFIVLVWFCQIPWRRNHLSTPSKYGRGHVGCIYLYRAAVAFRGSEKKAHWPTIQSDSIFSQRTQDKQDRFSSRHCFLPNSKTQIQNWPIFPKVQILIKL